MTKEIWKDIPGYEGYYKVSNHGRILGIKCGFYLKQAFIKKGYIKHTLSVKGKLSYVLAHRMVALAFISNPENKPEINHKNGIKTDNRVENLEWCTHLENMRHAHDNGMIKYNLTGKNGGLHPKSKVILMIKNGIIIKEFSAISEATKYCGLKSQSGISKCCRGLRNFSGGFQWKYK